MTVRPVLYMHTIFSVLIILTRAVVLYVAFQTKFKYTSNSELWKRRILCNLCILVNYITQVDTKILPVADF